MADWEKISDDALLKHLAFDSAEASRCERILRHKATVAVKDLAEKLGGVMGSVHRLAQLLGEKAGEMQRQAKDSARAQGRQQAALIFLSLVLAASTALYTWITWEAVEAQRQSNEIQRQLLDLQRGAQPAKPGKG